MAAYRVEICGVNTSRLPLLSEDEKVTLFTKIKNGDAVARDKYINGNLRLVLSVVSRFSGNGENLDDLFQIGCVGLIKAVDNFDTNQEVKFSTYAVPMIIGEIRRFLRDNSQIRISRSIKDIAYKAIYAKEKLQKQSVKEPTINEIANEIGVSEKEVCLALDAIQSPVSLYEPVFSEGKDTLCVMDQVSDKKNAEESWITEISLSEAVTHLPAKERQIVGLRFFAGKTQTEVANEIGISQAQVSRLEKNALSIMKRYLE